MIGQKIRRNKPRIQSIVVIDHRHSLLPAIPQKIRVAPGAIRVVHPPVENQNVTLQRLHNLACHPQFHPAGICTSTGTKRGQ